MLALDQTERGLTGLDRVSTLATTSMAAGMQRAGVAAQQSANLTTAAGRRMASAYGNVANQLADFVIQVQAGGNPVRALTQQLSQALIFIGPWGAALGAAAAVAGAAATAFLGMGDDAEGPSAPPTGLLGALGGINSATSRLHRPASGQDQLPPPVDNARGVGRLAKR